MDYGTLIAWLVPFATVAAAWGGVKVGLNGTKERVKDIHEELRTHIHDEDAQQKEVLQRIAAVETKVDLLHKK